MPLPANPPGSPCAYLEHQDLSFIYDALLGIIAALAAPLVPSSLLGLHTASPTNTLFVTGASGAALIAAMRLAIGANPVTSQSFSVNSADGTFNAIITLNIP